MDEEDCVMRVAILRLNHIVMPHSMKRVMKQRKSTLLEFLRIIVCDGTVCVIAKCILYGK